MSAFPSNTLIAEFFALITGDTPKLALYTSNPGPANTGTELAGGSYGRQAISFSAVVSATIKNDAPVVFNGMPSSVVTHWGIFDATSGGNLLAYGPLTTEITSEVGDNAVVNEEDIVITFAGS
jgi:hypothetical protein